MRMLATYVSLYMFGKQDKNLISVGEFCDSFFLLEITRFKKRIKTGGHLNAYTFENTILGITHRTFGLWNSQLCLT